METLIALLVIVAVVGIVWWAMTQVPMPPPLRAVANVVLAIVAILLLLQFAWPGGHGRLFH